jgi:pyridoxamine 5'-phosphate oxidase
MIKSRIILSESSVDPDPFLQFESWYKERLAEGIPDPDSMTLGTAGKDGRVSVRSVLLKGFDERGFLFFSNYKSRKGTHLQSNPRAALHFYWPESARQIRIEGIVKKTTAGESDRYFNSRPEESRISAWASKQSSIVPGREYLEEKYSFYKKYFIHRNLRRPLQWGGYRLNPVWFEFWQERQYRLHDRITYTLTGGKWIIDRLAP